MMQRILSALGYAVLDLDAVSRALAEPLLRDFEANTLDPLSTVQYLSVRYLRLCNEYGLPHDAVDIVASKAWAIVAKARDIPADVPKLIELYD